MDKWTRILREIGGNLITDLLCLLAIAKPIETELPIILINPWKGRNLTFIMSVNMIDLMCLSKSRILIEYRKTLFYFNLVFPILFC